MPKKSNTSTRVAVVKTASKKVMSKPKKAAGTSVAKKAPVKATKKVSKTSRLLTPVVAKGETCFWTHDGQVLTTIFELHTAVAAMKNPVFKHHVTKYKNDFADWTEFILCDASCAVDLRKATTKAASVTVLKKHCKKYTS